MTPEQEQILDRLKSMRDSRAELVKMLAWMDKQIALDEAVIEPLLPTVSTIQKLYRKIEEYDQAHTKPE